MIKVLIIDDNYEYVQNLFNILNENIDNDIKIEKICGDGKIALDYILNSNIDVILLDLNIPNINGIEILKIMKKNNIDKDVIVITGESDMLINLIENNLTVKKILFKPFKVEDLINILQDIIQDSLNDKKMNKILNLLNIFNFNKATIGYNYIKQCINYCIEKKYRNVSKIKDLYKEVSLTSNPISELNMSWNISKSIQTMSKLTDNRILEKYFHSNTLPTPKIFINQILKF